MKQLSLFFSDYWNIMLATDSYKASHTPMYPKNMTYMESYLEARGGEYPYALFFSLQYYIKSYLLGVQVTPEKLEEAKEFYAAHFGNDKVFDTTMWQYIIDNCGGKLPIAIEAVPEGSIVPVKNVLMKIYNTDPHCAKIVNWVETLLMKMWAGITIATNSLSGYEILKMHSDISGTLGGENFKLHDFGYRGVSSEETAAICGAAHLLNFNGTDTVAGIRLLQKYYNCKTMPAFSVPASEHSVMCSGTKDGEMETIKRIIQTFPTGFVSIVIDTWDTFNVCTRLGQNEEIKNLILNRDGKVVLRPDSGDPATVLEKCLEILAEGFGFTVNEKGFKVLNPKIGLIQGDGITVFTMHSILTYLESKKWSVDNLVFGSGGGLLQKFDRDTMKFAIKASYIEVDGQGMDIFKDPITAKGGKKSKTGKNFLYWIDGVGYITENHHTEVENGHKELVKVFENGELLVEQTYDSIKERMAYDMNRLAPIFEQVEKKQLAEAEEKLKMLEALKAQETQKTN